MQHQPKKETDQAFLRVPLRAGESVGHWRLGRRHEQRFDVPDQPMQGEMDASFFMTRDKNYIPHEYPCRQEFAARYRGRRPVPSIGLEPAGWWFPFGSPRVDLSGFWFRSTRVECWAATNLGAANAGTARFRFATCGGAILKVNGAEVAFLSRYQRNFEEAAEIDIALREGSNFVEVWFGDLCERDARYYFELSLIEGTGLAVAVPIEGDAERAAEIERLLAGMRFERSFCGAGEVALAFPDAASVDFPASVTVGGDFVPTALLREPLTLGRGERRLSLGAVDKLPSDFRHFAVRLEHGGFSLTSTLGIEICDLARSGEPAASIEARAGEALSHVAEHAAPGAVRALARLATGRAGPEIDAMLAAELPGILDCHDCADFYLVPLIWCRWAYGEAISAETRAEIDEAILKFRYWMDEPGNDVMWYFSENHALLFHTACYLAGALFPDDIFRRSGRTGREQSAVGRKRLTEWFDHFEKHEMAEWNSAPYFPIDFKGLAALFALAPDADIKARAKRAILRLLEIVALSSHQGLLTASQGRSYEHSLRPGRTLELSAIARLFFGRGWLGSSFHALPLLALAVRDHGLRSDPALADIAVWRGDGALEWCFRQGPEGMAALYHYKTRDYAMGTVAAYRPGQWGYQETVLDLRLGDRPEAHVWINHPGEVIPSGHARPSNWGGCGTLPRVHQYRGLAVLDFALKPEQVGFTHAWLPEAEMDAVRYAGDRVVVQVGRGLALLIGSAPFERVAEGPTAGCEIRLPGPESRWIVRLSDIEREGDIDAFARRFVGRRVTDLAGGVIRLDDPDYGDIVCNSDGSVVAEGRKLDPSSWTHAGELRKWPGGDIYPLPGSWRSWR
ncbi:MAG: hypothetical protein ACRED5_10440 [Propylenella sp.]